MKRGLQVTALLTAVMLCAFTCTTGNPTAKVSPSTNSSTQGHSGSSPSSSTGGTESPVTTPPSSSVPASPVGAALAITSLPFHNGEVGIGYSAISLGATGGTPTYTWSISAGSLPAGIGLSPGGVVSGTPSAAGSPGFTVRVTDAAGGSAAAVRNVTIYPPLSVSQPCANLCSVEEGCVVCGNFGAVSGGFGPYSYKVTSGDVPGGMGRSGLNATGPFPAPGPIGQITITVQVTDAYGASRSDTANWFIYPHIQFTTTSAVCAGSYVAACRATLQYVGGTPGVSPKVSIDPKSAPLPNGFAASASGGTVIVSVPAHCGFTGSPPAPACANGYTGVIILVLTDSSLCGPGSARCTSGQARVAISIIAG